MVVRASLHVKHPLVGQTTRHQRVIVAHPIIDSTCVSEYVTSFVPTGANPKRGQALARAGRAGRGRQKAKILVLKGRQAPGSRQGSRQGISKASKAPGRAGMASRAGKEGRHAG